MVRTYKLFSAANASTAAAASLRTARKGTIRTVFFSLAATAGAGVDGRVQVELSKQSVNSLTQNDTPATVLASCSMCYPVNAGTAHNAVAIPACNVPVETGDTLYINIVQGGTAPASTAYQVYMYVDE